MLSHMNLEDNLHLDAKQVDEIFNGIDDFLVLLETLHPNCFTHQKAGEVKQQLDQVFMYNNIVQLDNLLISC